MPNNPQITYKHLEEREAVRPILEQCHIDLQECILDDSPDIIVPVSGNNYIGIEVVRYSNSKNAECENALYKILNTYGEYIDKQSDKHYEITVIFHGAELPTDINFKETKNVILSELENCRLNLTCKEKNKYVSDVFIQEVKSLSKSHVGLCTAFIYEPTNIHRLLNIIARKEKKLEGYKKVQRLIKISEWWLVIWYPIIEHADFEELKLDEDFRTKFDHVFLTQYSTYKQLK